MKKLQVLGVNLKDYSLREALHMTDLFLEDGKASTIAYITTRGLMNAENSDDVRGFLEKMDITIPADSDILRAAGFDNRNRIREIDHNQFLDEFLKKIVRKKKSVVLLCKTMQQLDALKEVIKEKQPNLKVVGSFTLDEQEHEEDFLVNEINVLSPNVIISNIPSPEREEFFEGNSMKLNVDIWLMLKDEVVLKCGQPGILKKFRFNILKKSFLKKVKEYEDSNDKE